MLCVRRVASVDDPRNFSAPPVAYADVNVRVNAVKLWPIFAAIGLSPVLSLTNTLEYHQKVKEFLNKTCFLMQYITQ
jgi:hypothetical protein